MLSEKGIRILVYPLEYQMLIGAHDCNMNINETPIADIITFRCLILKGYKQFSWSSCHFDSSQSMMNDLI